MIPFNKPYLSGNEYNYIKLAVDSLQISGNGIFTKKCQSFFQDRFEFKKCLLTTSCTDALEMASLLLDIKSGDEVIAPSYTFVSTVNPFILRGAKIVFADSYNNHPNLDANKLESLITPKTRVIIPVHYAGVACDMEQIMKIAQKYNLYVIEDAAQAIGSYYTFSNGTVKPLGSIGHLSTFSFHETKNIISGEGGLLVINDEQFISRAEIIWEKGTNRSAFFRGEIDKYGWVDVGSSFLPSEIISAFLYAQLEKLDEILKKRNQIWSNYFSSLQGWASENEVIIPFIPKFSSNNAHIFYLIFKSGIDRNNFIAYLKNKGIQSVFHYLSLHKSQFYRMKYDGGDLPNSDNFSEKLVRLPLYNSLSEENQEFIINAIKEFNF